MLQDIHTEVGGIPYTYALESSSEEEDNGEEDLEDLLAIQDALPPTSTYNLAIVQGGMTWILIRPIYSRLS